MSKLYHYETLFAVHILVQIYVWRLEQAGVSTTCQVFFFFQKYTLCTQVRESKYKKSSKVIIRAHSFLAIWDTTLDLSVSGQRFLKGTFFTNIDHIGLYDHKILQFFLLFFTMYHHFFETYLLTQAVLNLYFNIIVLTLANCTFL